MMFPPSLALIIYGILTETSIGSLFIAGIIPGVLTFLAYVLLIIIWSKRYPSAAGTEQTAQKASWHERFRSTTPLWPAGLLLSLVLGGIYTGLVTPTESGALGAAGALFLGIAVYDLRWEDISSALDETANITVYVFILIIGATYFSRYIAFEEIVGLLLNYLISLPIGSFGILILVLLLYLMLGMFINQLPILILTLPITYPLVVESLGYPPLWFGIIIIKTVEIGMITPPIGLNVYVASNAVGINPKITFDGAARFIIADLIVLGLLLIFPSIVTYLPQAM